MTSSIERPAIYAITNTQTWARYIGSSCNPLRRWLSHRDELRHGAHKCRPLQEAWDRYGLEAFRFEVLMPSSDLRVDEQRLIVQHQRADWPLYNIRAATIAPVTSDADFLAALERL